MSSGLHSNDASDVSESRGPHSRSLKWVGTACIVLPGIAFLIWRGTVAIDINRFHQKSVDRGEPQTMAEIVGRFAEIKPEDNAAEAIVDIWEEEEGDYWKEWRTTGKMHSEQQDAPVDSNLPFIGQTAVNSLPWPEAQVTAARAFVESRRARNKKMKTALARPSARYPIDYTDGFMTLLPHLTKVKHEVRALQVENYLAIQEGRIADSIEAVDQMARMTATLKGEPFLISQLVRIADTAITLQGVDELIAWQRLDVPQLDQLKDILMRLNLGDGFYRSMLGERAGGLSAFGMAPDELNNLGIDSFATRKGLLGGVVWSLMKFSGYLSIDQRLMLDTYDQILVLSTNLTPVRQEGVVLAMDDAGVRARTFPPKPFSGMQFPIMNRVSGKFMNIEAERRLWLAALAVESYCAHHDGRLPEDLVEVNMPDSGGRFLDPFDGKTLVFQAQPGGYQLRSVDTDRLSAEAPPSGTGNDFSVSVVHHDETSGGQ